MTYGRGPDMIDSLIEAMIMRSIGGAAEESTISERWDDIVASRSGVRIREWLWAMVSSLACFGGLLLLGYPLVATGAIATWEDALLVGCGAVLVSLLICAAVELGLRRLTTTQRLVVSGIGVVLVLGTIALAALKLGEHAVWWDTLWIVVGLCVLGPSAAFTFNQVSDLIDPMGLQSAWERQVQPLLDHWMEQRLAAKVVKEKSMIPWRHANQEDLIASRSGGENVVNVPAKEDLTFADFLHEAGRRGITRRPWVKKGKLPYICPTTKEKVTRPVYDRCVEMGVRMGYLAKGEDGGATDWLMPSRDAYADWVATLEDEWGDVLGRNGKDAQR